MVLNIFNYPVTLQAIYIPEYEMLGDIQHFN